MYPNLQLFVFIGLCSFTVAHNRAYHFFEQKRSWKAAQEFCREHYTDLATVTNMNEMSSICTNQNGCEDAWIGLYNKCNMQWHWSEPEQFDEENVTNLNPTNNGNCVCAQKSPNDGKLYSTTKGCYTQSFSLCYDKHEDKYVKIAKKTWLQAQKHCRESYTDLVSGVHRLNNLLSELRNDGNEWWIGLFRDAWAWSDESESGLRNWAEDSVNKQFSCRTNTCAKLGHDNNQWNNVNCAEEHPFICYDNRTVLVNETKTFEEALVHCRKNYGELATMTDEHQQRMVQERAKMAETKFVWVGLTFACFFEEWMWVSGHWVSSEHENWENPKERHGCDVAGAMRRSGSDKWFKENIGERFNFVCTVHCRGKSDI